MVVGAEVVSLTAVPVVKEVKERAMKRKMKRVATEEVVEEAVDTAVTNLVMFVVVVHAAAMTMRERVALQSPAMTVATRPTARVAVDVVVDAEAIEAVLAAVVSVVDSAEVSAVDSEVAQEADSVEHHAVVPGVKAVARDVVAVVDAAARELVEPRQEKVMLKPNIYT